MDYERLYRIGEALVYSVLLVGGLVAFALAAVADYLRHIRNELRRR